MSETEERKYGGWYRDTHSKGFDSLEEFMKYQRETEDTDKWSVSAIKDLKVIPLQDDPAKTLEMAVWYHIEPDVLRDTQQHSRLLLKAENQYYPIRNCALTSIFSRGRISGESLNKLDQVTLAEILNDCLALYKEPCQVYYSRGKVSAVHSKDYCRLPITELTEAVTKEAQARFRGYTFEYGYADAEQSTFELKLMDNSVLDSYRRELTAFGKKAADLVPMLRFTTSNTAVSSASVHTYVCRKNHAVRLGTPIQVPHKNKNTVDTFRADLSMIYPKFIDTAAKLQELLHIRLQYPVKAMELIMDKIGIPKKLAANALQMYKSQYGINAATAHDVYWGISEVLFLAESEGLRQADIFALEDKVARALSVRWTDYDQAYDMEVAA